MTVNDLKPFLDKTVRLRLTDGEVARVKISFVDEEYRDIIVDVLETSRPEHYPTHPAAYTVAAADIVAVELAE